MRGPTLNHDLITHCCVNPFNSYVSSSLMALLISLLSVSGVLNTSLSSSLQHLFTSVTAPLFVTAHDGADGTDCHRQLKTVSVSSMQTYMSNVRTPLFASSLTVVPSRVFMECGLSSSNTTTLLACTSFFHGYEEPDFSASHFVCCDEFLWLAIVLQLNARKQSPKHDVACSSNSDLAL